MTGRGLTLAIAGVTVGCCLAIAVGLASLGTAMAQPVLARGNMSGVWLIQRPMFAVHTIDGMAPPLKPEGLSLYQQRAASRKAGDVSYDGATWCGSPGMPRLLFINYPFEITVRPRQVLFLFEWNRWATVVDLSGTALDVIYPSSMGVETGRWEGDTLVIDIIGLRADTLLDSAGLPHSENLRLTERLRLIRQNLLENIIRVEDPDFYSRPWEVRVTYGRRPGAEIAEDVCLDRIKAGEPAIKGE